jgi:hypothetical protein
MQLEPHEILGGKPTAKKLAYSQTRLSAKEIFRVYQDMAPSIWNKFNRKTYAGVHKYSDPRFVSAFCTGVVDFLTTEARKYGTGVVDVKEVLNSAAIEKNILASTLLSYGMPLFFVSPELLSAALKTKLPACINWKDLKLPYEAGVFILPKNSIPTPVGGQTGFVGYARLSNQMYDVQPANIEVNNKREAWLSISYDTADGVEGYRLIYEEKYYPKQDNLTSDNYKSSFNAYENLSGLSAKTSDFKNYTADMANLVFNLLLLMQERPDLVTKGRHVGTTKKHRQEIWYPNIIGKNYTIKRVYQGGSHASPRWHWRCGHWREQGVGKKICNCGHILSAHDEEKKCKENGCFDKCTGIKFSDVRRNFIAPVLVNGGMI